MSSKEQRKGQRNLLKSFRVSRDLTSESVCSVLSSIDTPRSLAVWLLFKYKEHDQMVNLEVIPSHYENSEKFRSDYLATNFLSKAKFLKLSNDRTADALKKFLEFEELCYRSNYRFESLSSDPSFRGPNVWLLHAVKRKISRILGDFSVEEMLDLADWGPGVTNRLKGLDATSVSKFQREVGITRRLHSRIQDIFYSAYPIWGADLLKRGDWPSYELGSVTVTVPKNAKIDRVISIEPGINLWFQKGIGSMIRSRLRRFDIDLNDQSRNQHLARHAYSAKLATVDFSSASDSISLEVVRELIPPEWFEWMDASRSHFGTLNNKTFRWRKFSSMGNGFTFELESLIFYAAACAVCEYNQEVELVSVYGDDVIIPKTCYPLFRKFSEFLGFVVNDQKSCYFGLFRESCGSHWFAGVDVKPFYMRKPLTDAFSVYSLANAIRRYSFHGTWCDGRWLASFSALVESIPKLLQFRVDFSLGDSGFVSNFDEAVPDLEKARDGLEGYLVRVAGTSPLKGYDEGVGLLLTRLRRSSTLKEGNRFPYRGRTRPVVRRVLVHQWCDLGPWLF